MIKRTSRVDHIDLNILSFASVFEIGDSERISTSVRVLAVQRQFQVFFGNEGNFNKYPLFQVPLPKPVVNERITMTRQNLNNEIYVKNIDILGISTSSILHIGSTKSINNEARVKHIRQLAGEE
ncbi:spore germination protein GerPE [Bacillus tianshenii]|nr:spore germination protein GerPE [Bacillus tianshenii]